VTGLGRSRAGYGTDVTEGTGGVSDRPFSDRPSPSAAAGDEGARGSHASRTTSQRLFRVWVETETGDRHVVVRAVGDDAREETVQRLLREVAGDSAEFMPAGSGVYLRRTQVVAVRWEEEPRGSGVPDESATGRQVEEPLT
jgi:hypothetical protein